MRASLHVFAPDLRYRWIEYLLAAMVIALVTSALVLQRSVTASAGDRVHDLAHRLGKNMLVVPSTSRLSDLHALRFDDSSMPDDYPQRIAASPLSQHIRMAQPRLNANVEVNGISLILVGEGGRDAGNPAEMNGVTVAELGPEAAQLLNVRSGDEVVIRDAPVVVTGIRSPPPDGLGMGVFTSLQTAQRILGRPGEINSLRLGGCWCRLDVPSLAADVEKLLPGTRAITVAGVLKAQKGTVGTMKRYSLSLYIVGLLLVGGTVIALISSQVRRSLREIGLLLALGASTATVRTLPIVKAGLVGAVGGLMGYLAGVPLTTQLGSRIIHLPLEPPPGLWLPAVALCVPVSMAAACVPAWRTAEIDPSQVLREE